MVTRHFVVPVRGSSFYVRNRVSFLFFGDIVVQFNGRVNGLVFVQQGHICGLGVFAVNVGVYLLRCKVALFGFFFGFPGFIFFGGWFGLNGTFFVEFGRHRGHIFVVVRFFLIFIVCHLQCSTGNGEVTIMTKEGHVIFTRGCVSYSSHHQHGRGQRNANGAGSAP